MDANQIIKQDANGERNFRLQDLKVLSFVQVDLSGSGLSNSNLSNFNLNWTDLKGANFKGANLQGAKMQIVRCTTIT
ncbi:pentapeptide repeat-containing protein (plasmid) [Kovacikia minuta CCNUW1]|uniref:pentapeptide repeat-containing protein n=1 Tax=Kovacikia minuta TaxID=2931930 RepID=UPI001CCB5B80|nr:pentapeptide repeat-containing protein [Kovacikia minuta]UBF29780.1 pentapeptide repeat-containing protein [Kovacikia minuta CCNUW1]